MTNALSARTKNKGSAHLNFTFSELITRSTLTRILEEYSSVEIINPSCLVFLSHATIWHYSLAICADENESL